MTDSPADDRATECTPPPRCVRITTGSRLHFGLIDTVEPFGGVGVMIDQPLTEVVVASSDHFDCEDQDEPRLRMIAERVARHLNLSSLPQCRITVVNRASAHCGLGSGTQLALSAAEALCRFVGAHPDAATLASQIAARGQRSAVGVHGFYLGGLIYEGSPHTCQLNPLIDRVELPDPWRVSIFRPARGATHVSGQLERDQFTHLRGADANASASLKAIVEQMIPAARQGDFAAFTELVQRYNETSGMLFASVQGGPYNGAAVTEVVHTLERLGARGVGQSSWGPGVFAWFESTAHAEAFATQLSAGISLVAIAKPRNQPRSIRTVGSL